VVLGEVFLRIPWGSGIAGSSPSSLKISSKDWEEIWRDGMPLFFKFKQGITIG
jgi:hypothetical protein